MNVISLSILTVAGISLIVGLILLPFAVGGKKLHKVKRRPYDPKRDDKFKE